MRKLGPLLVLFGATIVLISTIWLVVGPTAEVDEWRVARNQMKLMIGVGLVSVGAGTIMRRIAKGAELRRTREGTDPEVVITADRKAAPKTPD